MLVLLPNGRPSGLQKVLKSQWIFFHVPLSNYHREEPGAASSYAPVPFMKSYSLYTSPVAKGCESIYWWMDVILFLFKLQLDASEEANQRFKGGGPWEHHLEMNPLLWNFYRSWIITIDFCLGQHDEKQTNIRPTQIWIPLQKSHFWTVQGCNQRLFSFVFICGRKWAPRLLPPLSRCWLIRFWGGFFGPIK